jgi:hypothetical protein
VPDAPQVHVLSTILWDHRTSVLTFLLPEPAFASLVTAGAAVVVFRTDSWGLTSYPTPLASAQPLPFKASSAGHADPHSCTRAAQGLDAGGGSNSNRGVAGSGNSGAGGTGGVAPASAAPPSNAQTPRDQALSPSSAPDWWSEEGQVGGKQPPPGAASAQPQGQGRRDKAAHLQPGRRREGKC